MDAAAITGIGASLITIGTVVLYTGRVLQRVDTLSEQATALKLQIDELDSRVSKVVEGSHRLTSDLRTVERMVIDTGGDVEDGVDKLSTQLTELGARLDRVDDKLDRHLEYHLHRRENS